MRKDCCWALFASMDEAETGDEVTCLECHRHYIFNGKEWVSVLDIGAHKADKFRKIKAVTNLIRNHKSISRALNT